MESAATVPIRGACRSPGCKSDGMCALPVAAANAASTALSTRRLQRHRAIVRCGSIEVMIDVIPQTDDRVHTEERLLAYRRALASSHDASAESLDLLRAFDPVPIRLRTANVRLASCRPPHRLTLRIISPKTKLVPHLGQVQPWSRSFAFELDGVRYRPTIECTPTPANLMRARKRLDDIKQRIARGCFNFEEEFPEYRYIEKVAASSGPLTCNEVFDAFLKHCEARVARRDLAYATYNGYRKLLA